MRKYSSIFYMWIGFGAGIIATLSMFMPYLSREGGIYRATSFFYNNNWGFEKGAYLSLVGFIFILLAAIGLGALALPFVQPSAKVKKLILISLICLSFSGMLFALLLKPIYAGLNPTVPYYVLGHYLAGFYFTLIFGLFTTASGVVALLLDW